MRDLEELRASSGGIPLGGAARAADGGPRPAAPTTVERLKAAKEMLDNHLITDAEFEAIKAKVVSGL